MDQLVCCLKVFMCLLKHNLQIALIELALQNEGLIVPGYTHLQRAQPVLLQHLLLAYVEQVSRINTSFYLFILQWWCLFYWVPATFLQHLYIIVLVYEA